LSIKNIDISEDVAAPLRIDRRDELKFIGDAAFQTRIDEAQGYCEVWEIVKDSVNEALNEHRVGIMLFLDDLPLHLGAYHPLGTNNIVLNRILIQVVEETQPRRNVNAFIYTLLLHEYLHALGHISEDEVHVLVYRISKECFGEEHIATRLAESGPWALLKKIPLRGLKASRGFMEIVKDFERSNKGYIA
jgi:hypothetical protein